VVDFIIKENLLPLALVRALAHYLPLLLHWLEEVFCSLLHLIFSIIRRCQLVADFWEMLQRTQLIFGPSENLQSV